MIRFKSNDRVMVRYPSNQWHGHEGRVIGTDFSGLLYWVSLEKYGVAIPFAHIQLIKMCGKDVQSK